MVEGCRPRVGGIHLELLLLLLLGEWLLLLLLGGAGHVVFAYSLRLLLGGDCR